MERGLNEMRSCDIKDIEFSLRLLPEHRGELGEAVIFTASFIKLGRRLAL